MIDVKPDVEDDYVDSPLKTIKVHLWYIHQ